MINRNKKYLLLIGGIFLLIVISIIIVFFQSSTSEQVPINEQNQSNVTSDNPNRNSQPSPQVSLSPLSGNAQDATKHFYLYYISSPANPFADGAYKNNPYLTSDFKNIIGSLYNNGNLPVFCPQNKKVNIVIGQEQTKFYNNGYITQEIISEAPPSNKELYSVQLEQNNGTWQIFDINCL